MSDQQPDLDAGPPGSAITTIAIVVGIGMIALLATVFLFTPGGDEPEEDPGDGLDLVDEPQSGDASAIIAAMGRLEQDLRASDRSDPGFGGETLRNASLAFRGDRLGLQYVEADRRLGEGGLEATDVRIITASIETGNLTLTCNGDQLLLSQAGTTSQEPRNGTACAAHTLERLRGLGDDDLLATAAGLLYGDLPDIEASRLTMLSPLTATWDAPGWITIDQHGRVTHIRLGDADTVDVLYRYGGLHAIDVPPVNGSGLLGFEATGGDVDFPTFTLRTPNDELPRNRFQVRICGATAPQCGTSYATVFSLANDSPRNGDFSFRWNGQLNPRGTLIDGDTFSLRHAGTTDFLASYQVVIWDLETRAPVDAPGELSIPAPGAAIGALLALLAARRRLQRV